jgi:retron-type reverse transcriptase
MGRKASSIDCTVNNTLKFDDLYNLLSKKQLLIQAFGNLEKNKGRLTKGVTNLTIDGMNMKRIEDLTTKIKEKTFRFTPVRRVYVET